MWQANLASLDAILLRQKLVTRLEVEAGWYAVLRVPGLQPEEETALDLYWSEEWWFTQAVSLVFPGKDGWW